MEEEGTPTIPTPLRVKRGSIVKGEEGLVPAAQGEKKGELIRRLTYLQKGSTFHYY